MTGLGGKSPSQCTNTRLRGEVWLFCLLGWNIITCFSQKSPRTSTFVNLGDISMETTEKIPNITSIDEEIHEIRQISNKAKAALNRIREFANITKSNRKCQAASDCQDHQVGFFGISIMTWHLTALYHSDRSVTSRPTSARISYHSSKLSLTLNHHHRLIFCQP